MYPGPNATEWNMSVYGEVMNYWAELEFEDTGEYPPDYPWQSNAWLLFDTIPGGMAYTIDPGLKNPYADQFSLGIERELLPDFSIGATFIYKIEKNLMGWEDRGGEYVQLAGHLLTMERFILFGIKPSTP